MNRKNNIFEVHDKMTFEEFKNKCQISFELFSFEHIKIYSINKFGVKNIIENENDFQKSLDNKTINYYLTENIKFLQSYDFGYVNKTKVEERQSLNKNLSNFDKIISKEEKDDDNFKKELYEKINHFASLAVNKIETKIDYFLNSADYISDFMKSNNLKNKEKAPNKILDSKEIIKKPGLLLEKNEDKNDLDFILSLLAEILRDKKMDIGIYKNYNKEDDNKEKLYEASLQYLFCGLFDKKKVEINFNLDQRKIDLLNKKGDELSEFIEEWKSKIANQIKINKNDIYLINPKKKMKILFH